LALYKSCETVVPEKGFFWGQAGKLKLLISL